MNSLRFLLLLLSLTGSGAAVCAQPYSFIRDVQDDIHKIYPAGNTAFYTVSVHPNCGENYFTIRYYNRRGEVRYGFNSPRYVGPVLYFSGTTDSARNLYLLFHTSGYSMVLKTDSTGHLAWSKYFSTAYPANFTTILATGGGIYLGGQATSGPSDSVRGLLARLDGTGALSWCRVIKPANGFKQCYITDSKGYDGQVWLGGWYSNSLPGNGNVTYPFLLKRDLNGQPVGGWTYTIDSFFTLFQDFKVNAFERNAAGQIYVHLNAYSTMTAILKTDAAGAPLWVKRTPGWLSGFSTAWNGDGLALAQESSMYNTVVFTDGSGAVTGLTATPIPAFKYDHVTSLARFDSGYLVGKNLYAHIPAGGAYCLDTPANHYLSFVTLQNVIARPAVMTGYDVSLTLNGGLVSLTDTATAFSQVHCEQRLSGPTGIPAAGASPPSLLPYPQPAADRLYLSRDGAPLKEPYTIHAIDGRLMLRGTADGGGIDVSGLAPGLYLIRGGGLAGKFVKE